MLKIIRNMNMMVYYMLSSFFTALIVCAAIGLSLFIYSASAVGEMNRRQAEDKIELLADSISSQQIVMEEIAFTISTKKIYQKNIMKENQYYDILMLNDLSGYRNRVNISDSYFLFYTGERTMYHLSPKASAGSTSSFDFYFSNQKITEGPDWLYSKLNSAEEFTVVRADSENGGVFIFTYPIFTMGRDNQAGRATLGFIVTGELLSLHMRAVVGSLPGNVAFFYKNESAVELQNDHIIFNDKPIIKQSENLLFAIEYKPEPVGYMNVLGRMQAANIAYITVAAVFALLAAFFFGYSNYLPIKRLVTKYLHDSKNGKNVMGNIENYFDGLILEKQGLEGDVMNQYSLIKKQILELLLKGDERYVDFVAQSFFGITLPGPEYMVAAVKTPGIIGGDDEKKITGLLEKLSENGAHLYFIRSVNENCFAVLVNLSENTNPAEIMEYLANIFEEADGFMITASKPFSKISKLPDAFSRALIKCGVTGSKTGCGDYFWYDEALAGKIISAISDKAYEEAYNNFMEFKNALNDKSKSFSYDKMAYGKLLGDICDFLAEEDMPVNPVLIDGVVGALDKQELTWRFVGLLRMICDENKPPDSNAAYLALTNARVLELINYIGKNYSDRDLGLDSLSEIFNISTRYVSQIIKKEVGLSYKDFLTGIRMSRAREFLAEGKTVSETCVAVGYSDLSHFIRIFKQINGCTPVKYVNNKPGAAAEL